MVRMAVTEAAADEAVALLLIHYSCSRLRHHLDRAFHSNRVHRVVLNLQRRLCDVQKLGTREVSLESVRRHGKFRRICPC